MSACIPSVQTEPAMSSSSSSSSDEERQPEALKEPDYTAYHKVEEIHDSPKIEEHMIKEPEIQTAVESIISTPHETHSENIEPTHIPKQTREIPIHDADPMHHYEIVKKVFIGMNSLWIVKHKETGQIYNMKKVDTRREKVRDHVRLEIKMIQDINSDSIIYYHEAFNHDHAVWIILELIKGTADEIVDSDNIPSESVIAYIARELCKGLHAIHSLNGIHRNLKSENVVITPNNQVKLYEFGNAAQLTEEQNVRSTVVGNPAYMAPELVKGEQYTQKVDVWSMGICLYELAEGKLPYENKNPMLILATITKQPPPELSNKSKWSAEFDDFITTCLRKDPSQRPSVEELIRHSFVTRVSSQAEAEFNDCMSSRLKPLNF
jgi:serine/threonine protein kinase